MMTNLLLSIHQGFGPDGHTCSLFPNHPLLNEQIRLVASIDDSPKPPPSRITLTFPVLNKFSRQVIFCGAGSSKSPILQSVFGVFRPLPDDPIGKVDAGSKAYLVEMNDPPPYPCAMVRPETGTLVWVVDAEAAKEQMAV
jgi:6-phosphogluconolactonase